MYLSSDITKCNVIRALFWVCWWFKMLLQSEEVVLPTSILCEVCEIDTQREEKTPSQGQFRANRSFLINMWPTAESRLIGRLPQASSGGTVTRSNLRSTLRLRRFTSGGCLLLFSVIRNAARILLILVLKVPEWLKRCSAGGWGMTPLKGAASHRFNATMHHGSGHSSIQLSRPWLGVKISNCFFPLAVTWFYFFSTPPPPPHHSKTATFVAFPRGWQINPSKKFFAVKLNHERSCRREKNRLN